MGKRGIRRHHLKRVKAKAKRVLLNQPCSSKERVEHWSLRMANNLKNCSCMGCRNPRRTPWKHKTLKELEPLD